MDTVYTFHRRVQRGKESGRNLRPISRQGLADRAYAGLLNLILSGELASGAELTEVELARQMQVSRTPIREAIRRLAAEGLVVVSRNMRCHVTPFSRQDIVETYEVRKLLEAEAASRAATRMADDALGMLADLAVTSTPHAAADWESRERTFDACLHEQIAIAAGNERLRSEILRFTRQVQLVRSLVGRNPQRLDQGHTEHVAILEALQRRDESAAHRAMVRHLDASLAYVLQDLPVE